ncbi:LacI family DNA-binding transcriptional regulator [Ferruginibacter sp.]
MHKDITIYDLARELDLSAATVSRALKDHPAINKNTKKRIVEKAEEMGYRSNNFASNLRKQKSHTIGVIVHELNSNFITSVLAGIEKITTIANYDLIIGHSSELASKEIANANNLFHKRVDGLIAALAFDTDNMDHYEPFFERNIPVVFFDRVEEGSKGTKVIIDNYKAGFQATQHLIDQGCKRIMHITSNLKRNVYAQRYKGYLAALKENNIPFDESLLIVNDLKKETCIASAHEIASMKPLPDGIFTTNDLTAALSIQVLKERGIRVPEDIAVVGFNNDTISIIIEPKLTTINYPGMDIGEMAATHLVKQLQGSNGTNNTSSIVLKSELIIRESSLKKDKAKK